MRNYGFHWLMFVCSFIACFPIKKYQLEVMLVSSVFFSSLGSILHALICHASDVNTLVSPLSIANFLLLLRFQRMLALRLTRLILVLDCQHNLDRSPLVFVSKCFLASS